MKKAEIQKRLTHYSFICSFTGKSKRGENMEPNKIQIKMVNDVRAGKVKLPIEADAQADYLSELLLARDYETEEAGMMKKCKLQFIRVVQQKANDDGWVYLSVVRNVLSRRVYFKDLNERLKMRGIDAARHIARAMIVDGLVKKSGIEVMITKAAVEYLDAETLI